jgi:predicted secreted protein
MAVAAHPIKVYAKASSAAAVAGDEVADIRSVSSSITPNLLDVTNFKDTSGAMQRILGLLDSEFTLDGFFVGNDAPQNLLRASALNGASVWITLHANPSGGVGEKGYKVECKVSGFEFGGAVDGVATFSCSVQGNGAPALE